MNALAPLPAGNPSDISQKNYRELFEEAPIGMAVVALDERFLLTNATFCQMVGYSAEELNERTAEDITHREDVEVGRQLADSLLAGTVRYTGEKRYLHKNGQVIWVRRTACLIRDGQGAPHHFLLMIEDISERKRDERALGESRVELERVLQANQAIMDNSLDVICTVSAEGNFLSVNAACEDLWGYTPSELIGQHFLQYVHPDDRERTKEVAGALMSIGRVTDYVNRYIRKDGSEVAVLWSVTWSVAAQTMFCVAHDVTERAKIEKALVEAKDEADRANHAKSEFLSRMSHELRTPLNAILGFSQLLERQDPTETQRSRLRYILTAGRHLLSLINEVLDISRIEAGNLQLSLEPVSISDAVGEAIELMRPLATERSIALSLPSGLGEQPFVLADRQRLKQVLLNLLTNAVKYTPVNGSVGLVCVSSAAGKMRVIVTDTGAGISAEKLPRLFTPFDRLGAEQSTVEGTGLGLALCQRLMQAMNGTIGVDSSVGAGSNFWIELPNTDSPFSRVSAVQPQTVEKLFPGETRKVLYIEDNFSNVTLVEQMLADQPSIELITAVQGRVGLDLARQHRPDLILLDLHLPDVPGWEVLARLKADHATRDVPVVVISADATDRQIKKLLAGGARTYLTKPLDLTEFSRVVEETIAETNSRRIEAAA